MHRFIGEKVSSPKRVAIAVAKKRSRIASVRYRADDHLHLITINDRDFR